MTVFTHQAFWMSSIWKLIMLLTIRKLSTIIFSWLWSFQPFFLLILEFLLLYIRPSFTLFRVCIFISLFHYIHHYIDFSIYYPLLVEFTVLCNLSFVFIILIIIFFILRYLICLCFTFSLLQFPYLSQYGFYPSWTSLNIEQLTLLNNVKHWHSIVLFVLFFYS